MRLLTDINGKKQLDLNINEFTYTELKTQIENFQPEVIFALSDDENELVLDFGLSHWCHMGFFKPQVSQLDAKKIDRSRREQLAKIIFLDDKSPDLDYFNQCGRVIHQNYLAECEKLLNFIFFCDSNAFD